MTNNKRPSTSIAHLRALKKSKTNLYPPGKILNRENYLRAAELHSLGYTVVPCIQSLTNTLGEKTESEIIRDAIDKEVSNFPEFSTRDSIRVLGGFSALGNPASFHNPTVRDLRKRAYAAGSPVLAKVGKNLEMIIDRLLVRPARVTPSKESWHRDEAKNALPSDIIYGGWINLDSQDQIFSCVSGSHTNYSGNGGFVPISREVARKIQGDKVCIPPGHMLIFNEKIIHEVLATRKNYKSYRLFIGWRSTTSTTPLTPNLLDLINSQAAMQLKSGQEPPLYAKLHIVNHIGKLVEFTKGVLPRLCHTYTVKSGSRKDKEYTIAPRFMTSLQSYHLPMYADYSEEEIAILLPS